MASLIANCLGKLLQAKAISKTAHDAALGVYEGMQGRLTGELPPVHADAAAALEAAQIMAEAAKKRKVLLARTAIAMRDIDEAMKNHPEGPSAGLLSKLTRDIYEKSQGVNVESLSRVYHARLQAKAAELINAYNSKWGGLSHDYIGPRKVVRELFGEDTGDATASAAAKATKDAFDEGVKMAEAAGKLFRSQSEKDAWRLPQFWESERVKKLARQKDGGKEGSYFLNRIYQRINDGGLEIVNPETGKLATATEIPAILQDAFKHIALNESRGAALASFNPKVRVFRFKNAAAYLDLMDEFGTGSTGYYPMMVGHLRTMSSDAALMSVLSPNYQSVFRAAVAKAREAEKLTSSAGKLKPRAWVNSAEAAERTFQALTGELNIIDNEALANTFGAMRNMATAANLSSAVITAVPGDMVTSVLASKHLGIPAYQFLGQVTREIANSADSKVLAARLEVEAHGAIDSLMNTVRFGGEINGKTRTGKLAELVIRGQGLAAWTASLKRAFSHAALGLTADQSKFAFDQLDKPFQDFLVRHAISPEEWDVLRSAPLYTHTNGATYFDAKAVPDRKLADKFMAALVDERAFAVLESDARIQGVMTLGVHRGTLWGEMARSAAMYKSFSVAILLTHGMRAMSTGNIWQKGFRLAKFISLMTMAGAAATQAKAILTGKDPRDMSSPMFWFDSFFTGGGSGIYGDLFKQAADPRYQTNLTSLLGGPVAQLGQDAINTLTIGNLRDLYSGKATHAGRDLAKVMRSWTPNTWYTRLVMDRYVWDELQSQLDPDWRGAFARQEKRLRESTGQQFWWKPGTAAPQRAPNLGAAIP